MTFSIGALLLGLAIFAGVTVPGEAAAAQDAKLRAELEQLSRRTVFFGHQSVGENLVAGLERLAQAEGQPLRLVRAEAGTPIKPGTFAHGLIPKNGQPLMKLESFERAVAEQGPVDVAFMKFCYVDIGAKTDVRALFSAYQATVARLEAKHPNTTFVHVTVPLHTVQTGPKAIVKSILGKNTTGVVENARREEFNELLRDATRGKAPLFDLARIESTRPDGQTETAQWEGKPVRALVPAYSNDGGHLNDAGKERAARELVSVIAAVPLQKPSAQRGNP
jgi:lysophospholipase L1-like esterase